MGDDPSIRTEALDDFEKIAPSDQWRPRRGQ
jgi:hypothetical protein